jgi:3-isopropylmalate/(R)-2-methylmalate dehydratase small subunit
MTGRVWKFGDDIDTDRLTPGTYMKGSLEILASHCLESVRDDFAKQVSSGDFVVVGKNFGMGSSREQAAEVLRHLGVKAVIAKSFAGIFYRNSFNLGLLALISRDVDQISEGDNLDVDIETGRILNLTTGTTLVCEPVPENLADLVHAGGLVPFLENKFAKEASV